VSLIRGLLRPGRMFRLFRYYSIASAFAIVAATAVLVFVSRQNAIDELVAASQSQNVALARSFANVLWPRYGHYLASQSIAGLDQPHARPETRQIDGILAGLTKGLPVLGIKIFNVDGRLVYTTEHGEAEDDSEPESGLAQALREGRAVSKLSFLDAISANEWKAHKQDLIVSYLPIRNDQDRIEGVFELYTDVTPLIARIDAMTIRLTVYYLLIFGFLYGALSVIVGRADRTLSRQYESLQRSERDMTAKNTVLQREIGQRENAEQELRLARDHLETRVAERTEELQYEIAEREHTERILRDSEQRFSAVFNNSPVAITLRDKEDRFRLVNTRFQEWFGITQNNVLGKKPGQIFPRISEGFSKSRDLAVAGDGALVECAEVARAPHNVRRYVTVTEFPVTFHDGDVIGTGTIMTDVTKERKSDALLRRTQRMETIGQLTGSVAHDFNNLLGIILGNAELLNDQLNGEPLAQKIIDAANRGGTLTKQLLAYSLQQMLQARDTDIARLLNGMADSCRKSAGEGIVVDLRAETNLWPIHTDPDQLELAIHNLVVNAGEALSDGGTVTISASNIILPANDDKAPVDTGDRSGECVMISVSDDGVGMTPDVLDRATEPFFTTKAVGAGSGLGLSMVYGFTKQSGGFLRIESEPGVGTTVRLYFPRAVKPALPVEKTVAPVNQSAAQSCAKALIVEDDPDVRSLAVEILSRLGFETTEADNGNAALSHLKSGHHYDLLFTDVVMPGEISGTDLCREARSHAPNLKVIMTSGYNQGIIEASADDYDDIPIIQKPYRISELTQLVRYVFPELN